MVGDYFVSLDRFASLEPVEDERFVRVLRADGHRHVGAHIAHCRCVASGARWTRALVPAKNEERGIAVSGREVAAYGLMEFGNDPRGIAANLPHGVRGEPALDGIAL